MNDCIEKGMIKELKCGSDFAYIFKDESEFLSTEYKVLRSPWNEYFVPCMPIKYNGKPACYYHSGSCRPFESMLMNISAENFVLVAINILKIIVAVKSNGFLSCRRIESSFSKMFVDVKTMNVRMIYMPLDMTFFEDDVSFESTIRSELIKQMINNPLISSPATQNLTRDLRNDSYSIEEICSMYSNGYHNSNRSDWNRISEFSNDLNTNRSSLNSNFENPVRDQNSDSGKQMKLIALNAPIKVEIEINKPEMLLGKKEGMVDAVISFNKMISRVHCRVIQSGESFFVERLEHSNGTYINDKPLEVNEKVRIINGDIIRMADSDFKVEIK